MNCEASSDYIWTSYVLHVLLLHNSIVPRKASHALGSLSKYSGRNHCHCNSIHVEATTTVTSLWTTFLTHTQLAISLLILSPSPYSAFKHNKSWTNVDENCFRDFPRISTYQFPNFFPLPGNFFSRCIKNIPNLNTLH